MASRRRTRRSWLGQLRSEEARLRCSMQRHGKQVEKFTVQLEIKHQSAWIAVVRYDNAHGFCHRDTLHANGSQDKTAVFVGDINETFTYAIETLRAEWEAHRDRYLGEIGS